MTEATLGLDIGDSSIKAVKVLQGLKGIRVVDCEVVSTDERSLEENLELLFQKVSRDNAGCSTSLQADRISFRNLTMPFRERKKISQTLDFELEPLLPFSVDKIITDYILANDSNENKILSATIQKELLGEFLKSLAANALDPDVVEVAGVPTLTEFSRLSDLPSKTLFVDIGAKISQAILLFDESVVLVRAFHFGGETLTDAIAKSKDISKAEAERLKCTKKTESDGYGEIVRPLVASFCRDIKNTLHAFCHQITPEAYPEKVVLTGGGALFSGIKRLMTEYLELSVESFDLGQHRNLEFEDRASKTWNPLLMNGALALALRDQKNQKGFNFRIGEFQKIKKYEQLKKEMRRIFLYAAVLLFAFVGQFFTEYFVLKKQHNHFKKQSTSVFKETFPDVQRIVNPVQQMKIKIQEAKESTLLPSESVVQRAVVDVLNDVLLRIPKAANVDLDGLVIDEEKVRLKGLTDTFNTVDEIKTGLQKSSYLKDITIASAQLDRKTNKVRFELAMAHK